jgi:hypothetical protein
MPVPENLRVFFPRTLARAGLLWFNHVSEV